MEINIGLPPLCGIGGGEDIVVNLVPIEVEAMGKYLCPNCKVEMKLQAKNITTKEELWKCSRCGIKRWIKE